jgi:hypothetical protein
MERLRVSDRERSDFVFGVGVISTAVVAVAITLLLLFAALSPEVNLDFPGVGRCNGGECFGGGGGD